jgi:hypothetical protein
VTLADYTVVSDEPRDVPKEAMIYPHLLNGDYLAAVRFGAWKSELG